MKSLISIILFVVTVANYSQSQFQFAGSVNTVKVESNRVEFQLSNCLLNIYIVYQNMYCYQQIVLKNFICPKVNGMIGMEIKSWSVVCDKSSAEQNSALH